MGKLLINFSEQQEGWLREEASRLTLPGGVSELVRRAVDDYRGDRTPEPAPNGPRTGRPKRIASG